jgi:hypothetical protein
VADGAIASRVFLPTIAKLGCAMKIERPSPGPGEAVGGRGRRRGAKISWGYVAFQIFAYSLLVWGLTAALAGVFVATSAGGFVVSLRLSSLIMIAAVVAVGVVGAAGGPVPMSLGSGENVGRPLGMLSRSQDVLLGPFRAGSRQVRESEHNGLTALGIALVVVPQLVVVGSFV